MLSHSTVIRATPQQDLLNELHTFIKGALKTEKDSQIELTKTALRLLKNLPAARTALFDFFSQIFVNAASNYITLIDKEQKCVDLPNSSIDETSVTEIHTVLTGFIADNSTAWAPIVSTWSLELLGEISTKFAGRARGSTNLNDTLQLWMNCCATKLLVDINTKCLSSLMHSDTETCINALLDTSIKHSPNFDWVVAHVGSCFPLTVISRVLSCGLKDFCQIKSYEQGSNSPKLRSVVGILGHLASSHGNDIRSAILELFFASLEPDLLDTDAIKLRKKATVPFILQLAFLSSTLFGAVCKDVNLILNVEVIIKLYPFIEDWCKYFGSNEILEDILLTLIMSCEVGGHQIINLLLECAQVEDASLGEDIKDKSLELLQNVLYRVDDCVRHSKQIELLASFAHELDDVNTNLISKSPIKAQTAAQIVVFVGHFNMALFIRSVSFLFQNATNLDELGFLVRMLTHELIDKLAWPYDEKKGHFAVALEQIFSRNIEERFEIVPKPDLTAAWSNLLTLLKWEKSGQVELLQSQIISKAIQSNLVALTKLFTNESDQMHNIAEILDLLDVPNANNYDNLQIEAILSLTQATANYFFFCCQDQGTLLKTKGFERVNRLFRRLCNYTKTARVLALRELIERALFRNENLLFGTKNNEIYDENNTERLLLKQNKKINKVIPLTKHSSVFNGGIIGTGKRKLQEKYHLPPHLIALNITELINAIKSCCLLPEEVDANLRFTDVSLDSVTLVSLLLVQFVSPDVMYNGLPWPDEEFSKVTIERDLFIRRLITSAPVLWDLLDFIAVNRPALCYCSVILRALTATLIHQWKSTGEQNNRDTNGLMSTTLKVLDVMALGQLLPPPLSNIRDVLPSLKSIEIVAILRDSVWCYMRDHIPSPALFIGDPNGIHWRDPTLSRPTELYTNTLRIIMQRNIHSLGHLYAQMFINFPKNE